MGPDQLQVVHVVGDLVPLLCAERMLRVLGLDTFFQWHAMIHVGVMTAALDDCDNLTGVGVSERRSVLCSTVIVERGVVGDIPLLDRSNRPPVEVTEHLLAVVAAGIVLGRDLQPR